LLRNDNVFLKIVYGSKIRKEEWRDNYTEVGDCDTFYQLSKTVCSATWWWRGILR